MASSMHDFRACENNASARFLLHPTKISDFCQKLSDASVDSVQQRYFCKHRSRAQT